jgi:hypothetical protein
MLGYYLGVGVEQCPLCGGELIRPNGSRVLKLGGGEVFPHEPHQLSLFRAAQPAYTRILQSPAQYRSGY